MPMYIAPKLRKMVLGAPIVCNPNAPIEEERSRISQGLMEAITQTACALPRHKVVPYRNIPRRLYPWNTFKEVETLEKTPS